MNPIAALLATADNPLSNVVQHELFSFHIGSYEVIFTNHMLMVILAAILMLVILPVVARQRSIVPGGLRNFFESICVFIREEVARPVLGHNTDRFMSYLWTTFFFILFCNLLGMIPLDSIVYTLSGKKLQH